jgi:hypothetical protein
MSVFFLGLCQIHLPSQAVKTRQRRVILRQRQVKYNKVKQFNLTTFHLMFVYSIFYQSIRLSLSK